VEIDLIIFRGRVDLDSIIYSDDWRGYYGLTEVGYGKHLRVNHGQDEFVRAGSTDRRNALSLGKKMECEQWFAGHGLSTRQHKRPRCGIAGNVASP
jgi:hypothetical protein